MSTMPEKTNNTNNTKKKLTRVRKTGGIRKRPNARRAKKQAIEDKFKKEFTSILERINNCIRKFFCLIHQNLYSIMKHYIIWRKPFEPFTFHFFNSNI